MKNILQNLNAKLSYLLLRLRGEFNDFKTIVPLSEALKDISFTIVRILVDIASTCCINLALFGIYIVFILCFSLSNILLNIQNLTTLRPILANMNYT